MKLNLKARMSSLWQFVRKPVTWQNFKDSRYLQSAFWPTYLLLLWFYGSPYLAGLFALVLVLGADRIRALYMRALTRRIEAKDGFAWDVEVNQVKVGSIADSDYALIRYGVFSDVRVYFAQVLNLLRVGVNAFEYCFRVIPIGLFWIGVALAVFSPETISSVLASLQGATAESIKHAVSMSGSVLVMMMMLSVVCHWMFGLSRFGFINRFDEAIGTAVRKHCGVAADGSIQLSRMVDGGPVFGDELAFFRRERT